MQYVKVKIEKKNKIIIIIIINNNNVGRKVKLFVVSKWTDCVGFIILDADYF